jgi:alpha-2-macroglobulin
VDGVRPIAESFRGRNAAPRVVQIPLDAISRRDAETPAPREGGADVPIRFAADGAGRLYFELRLIAARTNARAMDAGISVERRLETLDGEAVDARRLVAGRLYRLAVTVTTHQARLFVACDVPLPSGLEGVDRSLATEAQLNERTRVSSEGCWWRGFRRFEIRDDRLVWFADELAAGRHELVAVVRATSAGTFTWPGARSEAMYEPEVCGRSAGGTVIVGTRGNR